MKHINSRTAFVAALATAIAIAVALVVWFFSPRIDEQCGFLTGRALRLVQNHRNKGWAIAAIVESRFNNVRWQAYHRDYLTETYVRCYAVDRSGSPVEFVWVVMLIPEKKGVTPHWRTVATAHSRATYELAPSLYEPGHPLYDSPGYANW